MSQQHNQGGKIFLILGFILNGFDWIFENMETFDLYFGVLLKITSLISFFVFMFLNIPRIRCRIRSILKKEK